MKILLFLLIPGLLYTQNLVVNPDFEKVNPNANLPACSYTKEPAHLSAVLQGWSTVALSTPDVVLRPDSLNTCYFPTPHSGEKFIGFINYLLQGGVEDYQGYHEYILGTLTQPLKVGSKYNIQFWVQHSDSLALRHIQWLYKQKSPNVLPLATNNIGIYFLENKIPTTKSFTLLGEDPHFNVEEVIKTPKGKWKLIKGTFTADKPYRYFLIGNFFEDGATKVDKQEIVDRLPELLMKDGKYVKKIWRIAYYCIDDVSIAPYDETQTEIEVTESTPYTFEKVLFNTGKATLLPGAEEELTELANYIKENRDKKFEIGGHTDNMGDDTANQILSGKRAKTVYDYLIKLGVDNNQLSYKGYGETMPKASNSSPDGRQENRRVECKVLK